MERVLSTPLLTLKGPEPRPALGEAGVEGCEGTDGHSSQQSCDGEAGPGCSQGSSWALPGLRVPEPGQPRSPGRHRARLTVWLRASFTSTDSPGHGADGKAPQMALAHRDSKLGQPQHGKVWTRVACLAQGEVQPGTGPALRGSRPVPMAPCPSTLQAPPTPCHPLPSVLTLNHLQGLLGGFLSRLGLSSISGSQPIRKHPSWSLWD